MKRQKLLCKFPSDFFFLFRVQSAVMANSIFPLGLGHFGKFKKKRFDRLGHLLRMLREN
jgi:hypothetical protein